MKQILLLFGVVHANIYSVREFCPFDKRYFVEGFSMMKNGDVLLSSG
jgi:hypothetical protein